MALAETVKMKTIFEKFREWLNRPAEASFAAPAGSTRPWTHEQETEEMTRPSSRPEIRRCIECGENEPETGYICDECRFDELGD